MEIIANLFAGLGLFFIGIRGIGSHMKQMTGHRFRGWVAKATGNPISSALVGIVAGIVTQSSNAVTFIVVSLVTSGMVKLRRALPILVWANVGTSLLVFLATLDIHFAVLYLLGVVGFCHYFGLNDSDRFRHVVGALFGVGTLFFGLWLIKIGAAPLKDLDWVRSFMRFSADSLILPFIAGTALTLVIQSSSTMSAIAVTMTAAGILNLDQTLMIVLGSNLGSGFGTFLLAGNLSGTGRQLALIQLWIKSLGVLLILPWFLLELYAEVPGIKVFSSHLSSGLSHQVAVVYLLLQLVSAALASAIGGSLENLAQRLCPPNPAEALSKPVYLYEQAIEEAETALDLVEKEQARLVGLLPRLLDELREEEVEGKPFEGRELFKACTIVATQCEIFIDRLMGHPQSHQTLERLMNIRSRNELLAHLQEGCRALLELLQAEFPEPAAFNLRHSLVEGLCTVLMVLEDALQEGDIADYSLILTLTSDRSAIMKNLREGLIKAENGLGIESQSKLLPATSLFERLIWLINRYAVLSEEKTRPHRGQASEDFSQDSGGSALEAQA